jgi:hypothetical protein
MNTLKISNTESPGGILTMEIFKISDVENCPILITADNANRIVFNESDDDLELYPIGDEMEVKEPSSLKDGGRTFKIQTGFTVKSQNPLVDIKFHSVVNEPVVFKAYFRNGNIRLYGSVVSPLFLTFEPYNGKEIEDGSGFKIGVSGTTTQKPVYLNSF